MKVIETFTSLQGEGLAIGLPTHFIRLAMCNLRCVWCDTPYSFQGGEEQGIDALVEGALASGVAEVCITGGEPLLSLGCSDLAQRLLEVGMRVVVETNGTLTIADLPKNPGLSVSLDVKCPGAEVKIPFLVDNLRHLRPVDQLKFVIVDEVDYRFAADFIAAHDLPCPVIFTPVGGCDLTWLAERVLADGLHVRVLPQLHKLIWGAKRGV